MPILQGRTRRYRKPMIIKYQILAALVGKDPASVSTVAWTVYQKYANGRPPLLAGERRETVWGSDPVVHVAAPKW